MTQLPISDRLTTQMVRGAAHIGPPAPSSAAVWQQFSVGFRQWTLRAFESDIRKWIDWWEALPDRQPLSSGASLEAYAHQLEQRLAPNSLHRHIWTISRFLKACGTLDQAGSLVVERSLRANRAILDERSRGSHRSCVFGWEYIQRLAAYADPELLADARNMAILCILYDTMAPKAQILGNFYAREWHVLPVETEDLTRNPDGSGSLQWSADGDRPRPRSYLSAHTMRWLDHWLRLRKPSRYLFAFGTGRSYSAPAWFNSVRGMLERAGIHVESFGFTSPRLGMAQDLLRAGTSANDIRDVAGWRTQQPVMRLLRSPTRANPTQCLAESRAREQQHSERRSTRKSQLNPVMRDLFEPAPLPVGSACASRGNAARPGSP